MEKQGASMNSYGNEHLSDESTRSDILTLFAASICEEDEPMNAMFAKAMLYSQDADRKLEQARSAKEQAEKHRAEGQKNASYETKEYCAPRPMPTRPRPGLTLTTSARRS
jgi:hypothetical protein